MKRPSYYVLLCAVAILATFSASGQLGVGRGAARPPAPTAVRLPPPVRAAATQTVAGSVWDTMGFTLVGAEVTSGATRERTDAYGRFRIDLPRSRPAELVVTASGYRPARLRACPDAGEPVLLALEPAAPWDGPPPPPPALPPGPVGEGYVRAENGAAVPGALVAVVETGLQARTDEVGRYSLPVPAAGATLLVQASDGPGASNGRAARSERLPFARQSGVVLLPELVARPAASLRGTVCDERGRPLAGVPLQVIGEGFARALASGNSGVFRVAGLLPGAYEVRAFAFRGALGTARKVTVDGPVATCELQLRPAQERRLQIVTEAGAPVARAVVATCVDGLRRGVHRADGQGWVQVRAAPADAEYDVRTGDGVRALRVVARPGPAADRLVVALP